MRLLQRAVLLEVGEDGADGGGLLDAGDDPHGAATVNAGADVDAKHALQALRPGHQAAAVFGSAVVAARLGRFCIGGSPLPAPRRRQLRAQIRVRREYAVEPGQMRARRWHQCRQLGDEVRRLDKFAWSEFEQPEAGPQGEGQDARSNSTCVVPLRHGVLSA